MNFLTLLEATIKLGIPMIVLCWIIFTRLYGGGELDRKSDKKSIGAQVKGCKEVLQEKEGGWRLELHGREMDVVWHWFLRSRRSLDLCYYRDQRRYSHNS